MDLAAWLRLTLVPGVGGAARRELLKAFGLPEAVFAAGAGALSRVVEAPVAEQLLRHDCAASIDAALAWANQPGNHLLTLADAEYPQTLLTADDPPILLYAKGRVELLNRPLRRAFVRAKSARPFGARLLAL